MKKLLNFAKKIFTIACKLIIVAILGLFVFSCILKLCENKYSGPQYEADLYQMIDDYAVAYGKNNNTELIHVGNFAYSSNSIRFGMWLRCYAAEELQQGRNRAITLACDFYNMLQQNKIVSNYFAELKRYYALDSADEINLYTIGIKIAYWDKQVNRPQPPYLAEITFLDEKFHYYQADPETQALKLVFEETYEDALANVEKHR